MSEVFCFFLLGLIPSTGRMLPLEMGGGAKIGMGVGCSVTGTAVESNRPVMAGQRPSRKEEKIRPEEKASKKRNRDKK